VGAYLSWGLFPLYWRQLAGHDPLLILGHRILWSFAFVAVLLGATGAWRQVGPALRDRRSLWTLLATTTLISGNWYLFIWAVNAGHITQASLGYYINPLINVLLGRLFLGERLSPLQRGAVVLAAAGVGLFTFGLGVFPWVSLVLAGSFGVYGLLRKVVSVGPLPGLAVETAFAIPFALLVLWVAPVGVGGHLGAGAVDASLLIGSGVVTAIPLIWFAAGARRLRYATLGILQYIAPTGQLALAVGVYGEPFTPLHGATFAAIWGAVALYLWDLFGARGRTRPER
jgi:chloramphenicol-sensitive protein RarD